MRLIKKSGLIIWSVFASIGLIMCVLMTIYSFEYKWFYLTSLPNNYAINCYGDYDYIVDSCDRKIINESVIGYCVYANRYILVAQNKIDTISMKYDSTANIRMRYGDMINGNLFFWIIDSKYHTIYGPFNSKEYYRFKQKLHIPSDKKISIEW